MKDGENENDYENENEADGARGVRSVLARALELIVTTKHTKAEVGDCLAKGTRGAKDRNTDGENENDYENENEADGARGVGSVLARALEVIVTTERPEGLTTYAH